MVERVIRRANPPYRFAIPPHWLPRFAEMEAEDHAIGGGHAACEDPAERAILLFGGVAFAWLTFDGRVLVDFYEFYEVAGEDEALTNVAAGAWSRGEPLLPLLLPPRPPWESPCPRCGGAGNQADKPDWACGTCDGLGWQRRKTRSPET